jgi:septal ring factor EnvC (AmiA/AmiB activator)
MKQLTITIILSVVISQLGCTIVDRPISPQSYQPVPATTVESMENRFSESEKADRNAVESALMWSDKYEELSTKTELLRDENSKLKIERTNLKYDIQKLQTQLDQTKAELKDANEFLQEMNLQLNKWKGDVLGFRDEMRKAQATQLGALKQIMKILGAELNE